MSTVYVCDHAPKEKNIFLDNVCVELLLCKKCLESHEIQNIIAKAKSILTKGKRYRIVKDEVFLSSIHESVLKENR